MNKPRRVHQLLHAHSVLKTLHERLDAQQRLLALVRGLLPAPLDQHCLSAQQRANRLILHARSSAWASRLRYLSRDLRMQLRDKGVPVQKIEVRVFLGGQPERPSGRRARHLSPDTAKLIEATADGIRDAALRAALKRLGRHTGA